MPYKEQKKYFETAYRTGTDAWTRIPYGSKIMDFISRLPEGAMVLDLGSGRGIWTFKMAEMGYRMIGIDYVKEIVDKNNKEVKAKGLQGQISFMEGNVLDIPFKDQSFGAVTDFGVLQHIHPLDLHQYKSEVSRVLKPGGYFLNISFSKETPSFVTFHPRGSKEGHFEKDGVFYHFFTKEEIKDLLGDDFEILNQEIEFIAERHNTAFLFSLFKKK